MNINANTFQPTQPIQENQPFVNNMINLQNQYIYNHQFYSFHTSPLINNINTNIAHSHILYIRQGNQIFVIHNNHFECAPFIEHYNWNNYIIANPNSIHDIMINYEYLIKSYIIEWSRLISQTNDHINNNNENNIIEDNNLISDIENKIIIFSNTMLGLNFTNIISV